MAMKKSAAYRAFLQEEQSREDGRTIHRLQAQCQWLARQLATAGLRPCYTPDAGRSAEDVARTEQDWLQAGEEASYALTGQTRMPDHLHAGR